MPRFTDSPRLDRLDQRITRAMAEHGLTLMRISLGVIFLWFGVLKFFPGLSLAEGLAGRTIETLTQGYVTQQVALLIWPPGSA